MSHCLREAVKPDTMVSPVLPMQIVEADQSIQPEAVLRRHLVKRGKSAVPYVLIKWTGMPAELATWENIRQLKLRFSEAPAWGQAGS